MFNYTKEKIIFYEKFSSMLNAGIRIDRIISFCKENLRSKRFIIVLNEIEKKTISGIPISSAMKKFPDVFSDIDISIASNGDNNGRLDQSFNMLSKYYKNKLYIRNTMIAKLAYPVFLIHAAFIIPTLPKLFLGSALDYFLTVIAGISPLYIFTILIFIIHKKLKNSLYYGKTLLRIPLIGKIILKKEYANFCKILSLSLNSGITVDTSLKLSINIIQNKQIQIHLKKIAQKIKHGNNFSGSFSKSNEIPAIIKELVETGEVSGNLPESLNKAYELLNNEAENSTEIILKVLPIFIFLIVGAYIASIIIGFYSTMYKV